MDNASDADLGHVVEGPEDAPLVEAAADLPAKDDGRRRRRIPKTNNRPGGALPRYLECKLSSLGHNVLLVSTVE